MKRVALISPCGWGNLGDAAILDALIDQLRTHNKLIEIVGLTQNPSDTAKRHGINTFPLCGFSRKGYVISLSPAAAPQETNSSPCHVKPPQAVSGRRIPTFLKRASLAVPGYGPLIRIKRSVASIVGECLHLYPSFRLLDGIDLVLVAGGGQLDDVWGGSWGHPWVLFRWSLLAKLAGVPMAIPSVGVGRLDSRLSRFFVRYTLRLATYRSYREQGSKDMAAFSHVSGADPVVPDLAFSYPARVSPPRSNLRVIGVSPMNFNNPHSWPDKDPNVFSRYIDSMAALIEDLVYAGYSVSLFPSALSDRRTMDIVCTKLDPDIVSRVARPAVETVEDLFETLATVDVTIASRLHGLLLSLVAQRPIVALSYERKVEALMRNTGNQAYCLDIRDFTPAAVRIALDKLVTNLTSVQEKNAAVVLKNAAAVRFQYAQIAGLSATSRTTRQESC